MDNIFVRHRPPNDFLTLEVPPEVSLRQLELALHERGVGVTVDRKRHVAYTHISAAPHLRLLEGNLATRFHESALCLLPRTDVRVATLAEQKAIVDSYSDTRLAKRALQDVPSVEILDEHQLSTVAAATDESVEGLCVFDEQGLGKTVQALFAFHALKHRGQLANALVLCPKNMVMEWAHDCTRLLGDTYRIVTVTGTVAQKRKLLSESADIYVTNFETAISLVHGLQAILQGDQSGSMLIVDESFYVKNRDTQKARAMLNLRAYARRCLVLCGTPAPNHPRDIVTQIDLACSGKAFGDITIPKERAAAATLIADVLNQKGVFVRRLKQVVMPNLPGKALNRVLVRLSEPQAQLYRKILADLRESILSGDEANFQSNKISYFAKRSMLLQICSCPRAVHESFTGEIAKDTALDQILHELVEVQREKVVIWSFYRESIDRLLTRYGKYSPVRIDGTIPDVMERRESIRRFQEDDKTMLVVANPAAAGAGITLHRARIAVYESMSNQAAHYLQSLDRIHRRGQTRSVEYIFLLSEGTLEVSEFENFQKKEESARNLLGDPSAIQVTRDIFLEELNCAVEAFKQVA